MSLLFANENRPFINIDSSPATYTKKFIFKNKYCDLSHSILTIVDRRYSIRDLTMVSSGGRPTSDISRAGGVFPSWPGRVSGAASPASRRMF